MLACHHPSHEVDHSTELADFPSTLRRGIFCPLKHDTIVDQHPQSVTSNHTTAKTQTTRISIPQLEEDTFSWVPFLALPFFFDTPLVPFPHTQHGRLSFDGIMCGANRSGACGETQKKF